MFKSRGFVVPVVLILTVVFVVLPILFWAVFYGPSRFSSIKGASTQSQLEQGLYVEISSKNGGWDVYEYLCKDKEECTDSLSSGKKIAVVSGGTSDGHIVKLQKDSSWEPYKYLKIYAKQGWGSTERTFSYKTVDGISSKVSFTIGSKSYDALVVDLSSAESARVGVIQDY